MFWGVTALPFFPETTRPETRNIVPERSDDRISRHCAGRQNWFFPCTPGCNPHLCIFPCGDPRSAVCSGTFVPTEWLFLRYAALSRTARVPPQSGIWFLPCACGINPACVSSRTEIRAPLFVSGFPRRSMHSPLTANHWPPAFCLKRFIRQRTVPFGLPDPEPSRPYGGRRRDIQSCLRCVPGCAPDTSVAEAWLRAYADRGESGFPENRVPCVPSAVRAFAAFSETLLCVRTFPCGSGGLLFSPESRCAGHRHPQKRTCALLCRQVSPAAAEPVVFSGLLFRGAAAGFPVPAEKRLP